MDDKSKSENSIISWLFTIIAALVLAFLITTFILNTTIVIGASMNPTLSQNDRLISLKFPLYYSNPKHGDIVVFDAPTEENKEYIKRVIGVPGDTIHLENGNVYVNGNILTENYIEENIPTEIYDKDSWNLSDGEYFVMGDNRLPGKSLDSRYFGPINKDSIRGLAKFRYWPISNFGSLGGLNEK